MLVATTVIEVGIDVANATVMVIEGAERFGVSQLHQLRGRVGRGEHASQCLLFADRGGRAWRGSGCRRSPGERDGFKLAEVDLALRGEGEILGTRQSGLPRFAVAELPEDEATAARGPRRGAGAAAPPRLARRTRPSGPLLEAARRRFGAGAADPIRCSDDDGARASPESLEAAGSLVAPRGWKVRPTSDRVREAIFSALGERVVGARVLDLYCGTGALAIEALSRGAARGRPRRPRHPAGARQRRAPRAGRAGRAGPRRRRPLAGRRFGGCGDGGRFDLVFVDAPYRLADRVTARPRHPPAAACSPPGGRVVVESGAGRPLRIASLERLRQRRYGAADVTIYGAAPEQ